MIPATVPPLLLPHTRLAIYALLMAFTLLSPSAWANTDQTAAIQQVQANWWQAFQDPLLDHLVAELVSQNIDIQIAKARLIETRSYQKSTAADFLPNISGHVALSRGNRARLTPETFFEAGFDTAWEIDVFGGIQAELDAVDAQVVFRRAGVDDAVQIVVADLARAVVTWRGARETIHNLNRLLKIQEDHIRLLEAKIKSGLTNTVALEEAKSVRAQTLTMMSTATTQMGTARYQIERLLNDKTEQTEAILKTHTAFQRTLPSLKNLGETSLESLKSRPDVRMAKASLLAYTAQLKEAETSLWPTLTLSSFLGLQSGSEGLWLDENPSWSLGAAINSPVFDFGRLRGAIEAADARSLEALLVYENTLNFALQETKTAFSDYLNGQNTIEKQADILRSRAATVDIEKARFENGLTDMIPVSIAKAAYIHANLSMIQHNTEQAIAYIHLQKALGLTLPH